MNHHLAKRKTVGAARFFVVENRLLKVLFSVVCFIALAVTCLIVGVMIGYSVVGNGNPLDVLRWDTWQHILDFLK